MPITQNIDSREIHLWCAFSRDMSQESLLPRYRNLLDAQERRRELHFYFVHDQRRYVMTRALVRTVLSHYADIKPEQWTFTSNRYGQLKISNADAEARSLSFNISHTNGLILLGVAKDRALGVDAENIRTHEAAIELADLFFAPEEAAALSSLPINRQPRRFLEYWILKESYMKAKGGGFSIPIEKFSFHFPCEDRVRLSIHPDLHDVPDHWRFWQFSLGSKYLVAVCAERVRDESPRLVLREVVPLVSERELETVPLRISE